jgi:hypothetical protein
MKAIEATVIKTEGAEFSIFRPNTELGKRLWALRQKNIKQGGSLLDWDELEKEVAYS